MKLYKLLFASALFLFISCNSDEDGTPGEVNTSELVGTWNLTSLTSNGEVTTTVQGISATVDFENTSSNEMFSCVFTENPNQVNCSGSYTSTATVSVAGQNISTEEVDVPNTTSTTTWEIENETDLIFGESFYEIEESIDVDVAENLVFSEESTTITTLTETTLVFESIAKGTFESQGNQSEFDITVVISMERAN